tara:strand:+ start:164 stop:637 length:474 start_codon:yes stop_codon:yes gene_type:complete
MAQTTFSGPVRSNRGFTSAGSNSVVNITAETTLTYADHVGRIIEINDADGAVTLPAITTDTIGATYKFFIGTDATDLDIKTDGTDKFVGSVMVAVNDGSKKSFIPNGSSNDVISMNGSTKGGDKNSFVEITALATAEYLVQGVLIGSGTVVTPFADS